MKQVYKIIVVLFLALNYANAQESFIKYKVVKNETIDQIAKKFSIDKEAIFKLNPDALTGVVANQILFIPNKSVVTIKIHTVEPKETLFSIARKYTVSVQDLAALNEKKLKDGLRIGLEINIPSKKKTLEGNTRVINSETLFHVVEIKETKYSIAKKYGITVDQLELQNPEIVNGLQVGTKLAINTKVLKPSSFKEELMIAIAEKQLAIEKARLIAIENDKLRAERKKSENQIKITTNQVENLKDSLTVQKDINQKVLSVNGMKLKLDELEDSNGSSVEKLKIVLEANKNIQAILVSKLQSLVTNMREDVETLKRQEISDAGTSQKLERQSVENLAKTNEMLQTLKKDLFENRKAYTGIMNDVQRVSVDAKNEYTRKSRENNRKSGDVIALDEIKKLQIEQNKNEKLNQVLFKKVEGINTERESIVKNKMKLATFYSEEARTFDDKMALEKLKRYKKTAEADQKEDQFKAPERNIKSTTKKDSKTIDISVIQNLNEVKNGYYLVLGIFKDAKDRDAFVMKLIDNGETTATFFYNVNSFTYYVYAKTYDSVNTILKGYKESETKKYHDNMLVVKIESHE